MSRLPQAETRVRREAKMHHYDEALLVYSRTLIARSLELLRQGSPSTYLGKKRQEHRPNPTARSPDEHQGPGTDITRSLANEDRPAKSRRCRPAYPNPGS